MRAGRAWATGWVDMARRRRLLRACADDRGFALLESMVAITVISIVMAALGTFFVRGVASSNYQRTKQTASHLADSAIESIRSLPASDLVSGRGQDAVNTQFTSAPASVKTGWLASMNQVWDGTAAPSAGATATLPTVPVQQSPDSKTKFSVSKYLGQCAVPQDSATTNCDRTYLGGTAITYLRVVVAVTWTDKRCTASTCIFATATLVTQATDPTFNLNQIPRPAPVVVNPGSQNSLIGDTINLQLAVTDGTGVPTFTWSSTSTFPAGLSLSPTGLISGTPTTAVSNRSITVTVTDGFLQQASATFSWTVVPKLVPSTVATQTSTTGTAITPITLTATGGSGSPYTWSDPLPSLPAGLTLNATTGVISGTPTTVGLYSVQITVKDSTTHTATVSWMWNVMAPLALTNPGNQVSTISTPITPLQLAGSGGSGSYAWAVTGPLPAGITFAAGRFSGTPTTLGTSSLTVTLTDTVTGATKTAAFSWSVVSPLVIAAVAAQTSTTGTAITPLTLSAAGGSGAYTWSDPLPSLPAGLTLNATTGVISGTPTTVGLYSVQITVRDTTGHTATVTWMWNVLAPLLLTNPGNQVSILSTPITALPVVTSGGSGSFTWGVTGTLPAGITFSAGQFTGTPTALVSSTSLTVTVTDTVTGTVRTVSFTWSVVPPLVISGGSNQISSVGTAITALTVSASGGGGTPYTWSDPNGTLPPGLSIATVTNQGKVTGTPTTAGTYSVQLRVIDTKGITAWTTFTWTVYPALVLTGPGNLTSTVATSIPGVQLGISGGSGTYTLSGNASLPAGLTMTAGGLITGTPTTVGSYPVSITLTDPVTSLTKTISFTWTIAAKPTVTAPANQKTTTTATLAGLPLTTTCPNGPCTYTLNNGPAGLTVGSSGVITGTVTSAPQVFSAVSVTVRDASGVTATSGTFTWTIADKPSVTAPADQTTTLSANVSVPLGPTCPNGPCSYSISNGPTGLSVTSGGVITGTVGGTAQTYSAVTVSVTDASGVVATTARFNWTVNPLPTITSPGNQLTFVGTTVSLDLSTLDGGGTAPYTYSATGLPSWLALDPNTGLITGTAPATKSVTPGITVTVRDAAGVTATSASFKWTVTDLKLAFGDQTTYRSTLVNIDLDNYASGGTGPYTYTVSGLPTSWLSYNSLSHVLSGTSPSTSTGTYSGIVITITDSASPAVSITNAAITWHVTNLRWTSTPTAPSGTKVGVTITSFSAGAWDSGGSGTLVYTATGLPPGISIASGGTVSGKPTVAGSYTVRFTVTDGLGASVTSNAFTWTVSP